MVENLSEVISIVKQLRETSGTNDKIVLLRRNCNNELLRKVLRYTYDTDLKYGVQKKSIVMRTGESKWSSLFEMLDELAESNINDNLKRNVGRFINNLETEDEKELVTKILLKNLDVGLNVKNINKGMKGLITTHDIQLGSKWEGNLNEEVAVSLKLDGVRCTWLIKDGKAIAKTRQNKIIQGMEDLTKAMEEVFGDRDLMVDGELLAQNPNGLDSKELFKLTSGIVNSKGIKKGLTFVAFDIVPLEDYVNKVNNTPFLERRELLEHYVINQELVKLAPFYFITDSVERINEKLNEVVSLGLEGLMINKLKCGYEFKRTKNLLKVKAMSTMDLRVIAFEEGDGAFEGILGAIVVKYKGNEVRVGSGFTQDMRAEVWNNQDKYKNVIAEIQYFEVTKNEEGKESLRFPVFKGWRFDKDEESYE
jgi:DNA ligase-1